MTFCVISTEFSESKYLLVTIFIYNYHSTMQWGIEKKYTLFFLVIAGKLCFAQTVTFQQGLVHALSVSLTYCRFVGRTITQLMQDSRKYASTDPKGLSGSGSRLIVFKSCVADYSPHEQSDKIIQDYFFY